MTTTTTKTPDSSHSHTRRTGWKPLWLLAFVLALPSCFEVSCIKLTGCELFADKEDGPTGPVSSGEEDITPRLAEPSTDRFSDALRDLFILE